MVAARVKTRWFLFVFLATIAYGAYKLQYFYTTPETLRAFYSHRAELERAVRMKAGNGGADGDVDSDELKRMLAQAGFTSIRSEGRCIIFYFTTFMAGIDSWHEIVYSPKGHAYLPDYRRREFNTLYELRNVDSAGQWFYVVHD